MFPFERKCSMYLCSKSSELFLSTVYNLIQAQCHVYVVEETRIVV